MGDNIDKHPLEFDKLLNEGHTVANHTYHHLNGWKTETSRYTDDVSQCQLSIDNRAGSQGTKLFRPPYGKISRKQIKAMKSEYEIMMWSYLTGDFDQSLQQEKCLQLALNIVDGGDIVVFHDHVKSYHHLQFTLPTFLYHFTELGFEFKSL